MSTEAGWQTMETAPRDGTSILVWDNDSQEMLIAHFSQYRPFLKQRWVFGPDGLACNPILWMHLPGRPKRL